MWAGAVGEVTRQLAELLFETEGGKQSRYYVTGLVKITMTITASS